MPEPRDVMADKLANKLQDEWSDWEDGPIPALEAYIEWLPEDRREAMLLRLLPIDREHRRRLNLPATMGTYLALFPGHRRAIRKLFGLSPDLPGFPEGEAVEQIPLADDFAPSSSPTGLHAPAATPDTIPLETSGADAPPAPIRVGPSDAMPRAPRRMARPKPLSSFSPVEWDPHADDPPRWWKALRIQLWITAAFVAMLGIHLLAQFLLYRSVNRVMTRSGYYDYDPFSYGSQTKRAQEEQAVLDRQFWTQATANLLMGLTALTVLGYLGLGAYFGLEGIRRAVEPPAIDPPRRGVGASPWDEDEAGWSGNWRELDLGDLLAQSWRAYGPPERLSGLGLVVAGFLGMLMIELASMLLARLSDIGSLVPLADLSYLGTVIVGALLWLALTVPLMRGSERLRTPAERRWVMGLLAVVGATLGLAPVLPIFIVRR